MNGMSWIIMEKRQRIAAAVNSDGLKGFAYSRYYEAQHKFGDLELSMNYGGGPYYIVYGALYQPEINRRVATLKSSFLLSYVQGIMQKFKDKGMTTFISEVNAQEEIPIAQILDDISYPTQQFSLTEHVKLDLLPPKWVDV